jgi:hypothetical protein
MQEAAREPPSTGFGAVAPACEVAEGVPSFAAGASGFLSGILSGGVPHTLQESGRDVAQGFVVATGYSQDSSGDPLIRARGTAEPDEAAVPPAPSLRLAKGYLFRWSHLNLEPAGSAVFASPYFIGLEHRVFAAGNEGVCNDVADGVFLLGSPPFLQLALPGVIPLIPSIPIWAFYCSRLAKPVLIPSCKMRSQILL